MNAAVLIAEARSAGLHLQLVANDRMKWSSNGPPPPLLLTRLKAAKAGVLAELRAEHAVINAMDAADRLYEFEERAAILEYCGGMTRAEAEAAAKKSLSHDSF